MKRLGEIIFLAYTYNKNGFKLYWKIIWISLLMFALTKSVNSFSILFPSLFIRDIRYRISFMMMYHTCTGSINADCSSVESQSGSSKQPKCTHWSSWKVLVQVYRITEERKESNYTEEGREVKETANSSSIMFIVFFFCCFFLLPLHFLPCLSPSWLTSDLMLCSQAYCILFQPTI